MINKIKYIVSVFAAMVLPLCGSVTEYNFTFVNDSVQYKATYVHPNLTEIKFSAPESIQIKTMNIYGWPIKNGVPLGAKALEVSCEDLLEIVNRVEDRGLTVGYLVKNNQFVYKIDDPSFALLNVDEQTRTEVLNLRSSIKKWIEEKNSSDSAPVPTSIKQKIPSYIQGLIVIGSSILIFFFGYWVGKR